MRSDRLFRVALLIFAAALMLSAQTGSGTVQTVVRDVSSAIVAGAGVTIVTTATGMTTSTTTNGVGLFGFPPVVPGSYEIKVEARGMPGLAGQIPGMDTSGGSGILSTQNFSNSPRVVQTHVEADMVKG